MSSQPKRRILRARLVLPVSHDPVENGAVVISGGLIESVGAWKASAVRAGDEVFDLGESILLPGLINAHCHLDYTAMAGQVEPTSNFVDWVGSITSTKGGWIYSDFAASWLAGASMLLKTGTTTVADIEMAPELLPDVWSASPLRIISFLEMTGVKSRRPPKEILNEALHKIESVAGQRNRIALSPHAPYSTTPELLRLCADVVSERNIPVTTHVAESAEEFEMFQHGGGRMHDWISRSGRNMNDCGIGSPVEHLHRQGLLSRNLIAVHANYLTNWDIRLLATNQVSVAHCPGSHAYFKHQAFRFEDLDDAGVNVCLGTDSLASALKKKKKLPELNMFEEMRQFGRTCPKVSPEEILKMATVHGARALGMANKAGELSPGCHADLVAIPFEGATKDCFEAVIHHAGPVGASVIDGAWALAPGWRENQQNTNRPH